MSEFDKKKKRKKKAMRHNIIVIQVLERVYNVAFPALYL